MLRVGDLVYLKPFNCLLNTDYTEGIDDRRHYVELENPIHRIRWLGRVNFNVDLYHWSDWNLDQRAIDKNRKVI